MEERGYETRGEEDKDKVDSDSRAVSRLLREADICTKLHYTPKRSQESCDEGRG